ncbi:MAG: YARHG domain-containing protein [Bacteroidaceae bacterium]|nr:YARHG domain-containing protein [Bacteroidaceae bacterium]
MALINCPHCGAQISDTASKCPKCGFQRENQTVKKKTVLILIAILGGLLILIASVLLIADSVEKKGIKDAREQFVKDSLEKVRLDSIVDVKMQNQMLGQQESETEEDDYVYADTVCTEEEGYETMLSERKLSTDDVEGMSKKELEILRNSIYARYGYKFKRDDLFNYFSQFSWYNPYTGDMSAIYNQMSSIEKYNVEFIKKFE